MSSVEHPLDYPGSRQMRRWILPASVVAAAVALIVLLAFGVSQQGDNTSLDAAVAQGKRPPAPNASTSLPVLGQSSSLSLADFRGKVVVLNVFASWCDPCKAEAPILEHAQQQIAGQRATVLGVTYLDNSSDSAQFVRQEHITYPVIRDVNGNFVRSFGDSTGVPETFVIDRAGRVVAIRRFQIDDKWLSAMLSRILGQPA